MNKPIKSFVAVLAPLLFLILAYWIDLALMRIADASNTTLTVLSYRPAIIALLGLFALEVVVYIWFLVETPTAQPWNGLASLIIAVFILLYPYILLLKPDSAYLSLPGFWKMFLSLALFGSPRSYTFIAANILLVSALVVLGRHFLMRRED